MLGFKKKKKQPEDILELKKQELADYTNQFNNAVSFCTNMIDIFDYTSKEIDIKIGEIEDYKNELTKTETDLVLTKEKNERVIRNFRTLLAE